MIPLADQIKTVQREIRMRETAYPRWVASKKLLQTKADYELDAMRAVLETLRSVEQKERLI